MHWTEVVGWVGVTMGVCVNLPQAYRIWQTKSSRDVAVWTYRLLLLVVICYLIRAIAIREWVFIISNSVAIFVTILVLLLKRRYR